MRFIHGEIFTAPTSEGDLIQITDGPARDQAPAYSPDGQRIAYVSDRSGREEIYIASADGAGEHEKITSIDALKLSFSWAPDSKSVAFVSSDGTLRRYDTASRKTIDLVTSRFGAIGTPVWSPDGRWIAYSRPDYVRTSDVYVIPSAGGEERKATFDSYNQSAPRFAPNGRKLLFLQTDGFAGRGGAGSSTQLYAITLEREESDPDDPAVRRDTADDQPPGGEARPRQPEPPGPVTIDWPGLKRRTRQITRMPFPVLSYEIAPDSRTIAFVTTEPAGLRTVPVLYTIQQDGRRLTRGLAGGGSGDEDDDQPPAGGAPGDGISSLAFARDGRTLYFREGRGVHAVGIAAQPGAGGAASAPSGGREAARRRISFTPRVRIDLREQWQQMFGDAWRTMKYRFYDPTMHGHDWDAMRAKYAPLVEHVGDRQELLNIINEMIGELNASHTGAAPGGGRGAAGSGVSTGYLGFDSSPTRTGPTWRTLACRRTSSSRTRPRTTSQAAIASWRSRSRSC